MTGRPATSRARLVKILAAGVLLGGLAGLAAFRLRGGGTSADDGPVLPEYAVSAGDAADGALHVHGDQGRFDLVVQPKTQSVTRVVAYAFTMDGDDAEPNALDASAQIDADGRTVHFRGDAKALRGARELRVVIGIANASIARFEDALTAARAPGGGARLVTLRVPIVRD